MKDKKLNIQNLIEKTILYVYNWTMNRKIVFCQVAKIEFAILRIKKKVKKYWGLIKYFI